MTDLSMAEVKDETWVERARSGDVEAFEELVRRHQRGLYAFCWRLTGEHDEADETAQEAFVRAYRSLHRFRGESRFGTWLRQIALNLVRSRARRRRLETMDGRDLDLLAGSGAEVRPSALPSPATSDPIQRRRLAAAVADLPERQHLTLMLKVYEDMTHAEVARLLGCTVGTVKANLFHALRRLRRSLGGRP